MDNEDFTVARDSLINFNILI